MSRWQVNFFGERQRRLGGALHMLGQSDGRVFYQGQAAGEELGRLWVTDLAAGQTAPACTVEG